MKRTIGFKSELGEMAAEIALIVQSLKRVNFILSELENKPEPVAATGAGVQTLPLVSTGESPAPAAPAPESALIKDLLGDMFTKGGK
jgi:hypothetical protein